MGVSEGMGVPVDVLEDVGRPVGGGVKVPEGARVGVADGSAVSITGAVASAVLVEGGAEGSVIAEQAARNNPPSEPIHGRACRGMLELSTQGFQVGDLLRRPTQEIECGFHQPVQPLTDHNLSGIDLLEHLQ